MGAERTEIPLLVKGTGRAHTELKKQYVPVQYPRGIYGSGADRNASAG